MTTNARRHVLPLTALLVFVFSVHPLSALLQGPPPLKVVPPPLGLNGVRTSIAVSASGELPVTGKHRIVVRDEAGRVRAEGSVEAGSETVLTVVPERSGERLTLFVPGLYDSGTSFSLRTLPGWLTLLPPFLAILLALLFRQVVPALFAGVWVGAWMIHGGPLVGALRTVDQYFVSALADSDHVSIVIFSLMLGGMVGIISRAGGMIGLIEAMRPFATSRRRGQVVTWLLGLFIFFDDYANTLLVGNTMRPVTDRLKVSREKLAYIVDSTAAPVASIALVSTWIGYEVSLIGDSLSTLGSDLDPYSVFLQSLPYNFYPFLALVFGFLIALSGRDLGPMLTAERRALGGKVLSDGAAPLADFDNDALRPSEGRPRRWVNAMAPVLTVLVVTFAGLWLTGRSSLLADGDPLGTTPFFGLGFEGIGGVFGAGESYKTLLWGSTAGCIVALVLARAQGILGVGEGLTAWVTGIKSMTLAMVILLLAWSISSVCSDLNTSGFMVTVVSDVVDPRLLPTIVFVLASLTAFATGTSWTTMGILIPLAVPTSYAVAQTAGLDPASAHGILLGAVSAVLAGAILGDHCSPISDTTVMSSMASGCDHVDHVRTQLPYALIVGVSAIVFGYLPSGYGVPPLVCLLLASAALGGVVLWAGRPSRD